MNPKSISSPNSGKQRLWIVSELYYPELTSTGYYLTKIGTGLSDTYKVKVICGQPNYSARGTFAPKHEVHENVEIFRAAGTRFNKNHVPLRLINMATLGISILRKALLKFRRGDVALVVTTPPNVPFIVAIASLIRGSRYVLLIHDNYPEILVAAGTTRENGIIVRTIAFANRWLYKHASKIITVGRDMKELVERKTEGLEIPIAMIPNWAELESIDPQPREANAFLRELGISDRLVFLYAGNMGPPNDLESIVECAKRLEAELPVHFLFLGDGIKRKWLVSKTEELDLKNVTIFLPRPRGEQQVFLNSCDIGIVSLVSRMKGVSMPSRTYNLMAAGKPILAIAEKGSEIDQVVSEYEIGWTVKPESPDELVTAIRDIYGRLNELGEIGDRARKAAESDYDLTTALDRYRRELA